MFFYSPFLGDRKKRCRTDKPSKNKASDLFLFARRRTKVRRVARFVCSIKLEILNNFCFFHCLRGSYRYLSYKNPLIYIVLCGLRFFYIPFFMPFLFINLLRYIGTHFGIFCIKICTDFFGIFRCKNCSAYHYFAICT